MQFEIRRSIRPMTVITALVSMTLAPAPAAAQEAEERPWQTRVSIGRVFSGHEPAQVQRADGQAAHVTSDNGIAVLYDVSRRVSGRMRFMVGFGYWTFPSRLSASPEDELDGFRSGELHLGVVYATNRPRLINPHVGALLVATASDVAVTGRRENPTQLRMASKVGPAVQAGVLVGGCGSQSIGIDLSVRRSLLRTTVSGGAPFDLSPWLFSVGVSIRH